jgi:hypothetical protein
VAKVTGRAKIQNEKKEMRKRGKRAPGIEEAHPFAVRRQSEPECTRWDIGTEEIVACVRSQTMILQEMKP